MPHDTEAQLEVWSSSGGPRIGDFQWLQWICAKQCDDQHPREPILELLGLGLANDDELSSAVSNKD
jgi:hypothetical protein